MRTNALIILTSLFFLITKLPLFAIKLEGEILNYEKSSIELKVLYGSHYVYDSEIEIELDETGSFSYEVKVNEIRFGKLIIGDEEIGLFIDPNGKRIKVSLDFENPKGVKFEGEHVEVSEFVNNWLKKRFYQEYEGLTSEEKDDINDFDTYCELQEKEAYKKLELIKNGIKTSQKKLLRSEIENYYLLLKVTGGIEKGYTEDNGELSEWMKRNDQIFTEINCNKRDEYTPSYNNLLFAQFKHSRIKMEMDLMEGNTSKWLKAFEVETFDALADEINKDKHNRIMYELGKEWDCSSRFKKALSNTILWSNREGYYENLYWLCQKYMKLDPTKEMQAKMIPIMKRLKEFESSKDREEKEINFYPKKAFEKGISSILNEERYQGKVLVLDMWGTWCSPCREQFPYMKKLKEQLAKEKDLAFLYFSAEYLKNPEEHWMETVKYFDLEGDHYLATKEVMVQFRREVKEFIPGEYPMYIIVNKKGEIAKVPAAYPSDGDKLVKQIRDVLMEE